MSRRTLLRAAATAAGGLTAGCGQAERPLQVVVVWSDGELERFNDVVRSFRRPVKVISAGDNIDPFLRARHLAGTSPDVAILPRPGLINYYANRGWLSRLDESLGGRYLDSMTEVLRSNGTLFGAWVKAAHKSLFWYRRSVLDPPLTWDQLVLIVRDLGAGAGRTGLAPLAIGGADGWVLTDWFENVLAALTTAEEYAALASTSADWKADYVRGALERLAELWALPGAFPGGGSRALLTQVDDSVIQVVTGKAAMVFEGDFVQATAETYQESTDPVVSFRFPAIDNVQPLVVGGDAAVILRDSEAAHGLVEWLARPETFQSWIAAGGYLSPLQAVSPTSYPPERAEFAEDIQKTGARFDLSDRLRGLFTGFIGVGIWRILQDFFEVVTTTGTSKTAAVKATVMQLDVAARQAARSDGGGL